MRCDVAARSPKRRSASRTASAKPAPPGTTSSGCRVPSSPSIGAQRRQRVLADPAADLDDGQHARAASSAASAAAGPVVGMSATARPMRSATSRPRKAPMPTATTGASAGAARGAPRPRSGAVCSPCEERRDRVDLGGVELVDVGADEPGDALARELDGGRAAVGRRAVVGLRRQMAEHEMDVGADREVLGRDRAPLATDRHARRDRREVRAQHAGVDELAGQQPLEVVATGRGDAPAGDRDDVGGRAADVDEQRVGMRVGDRERGRHPVGGGDVPRPRARRLRTGTSSPATVSTLSSPSAASAASSTNSTPSRLVRNASDSSAVIVIATASAGPASAATSRRTRESASRSRQISNGRETVRSDPCPAARPPSCSRRRCPLLAWRPCGSCRSSISRTAWRFTPCAASANATARSAASSPATTATRSRWCARSAPSSGSTSSTSPTSTPSAARASTTRPSPRWHARRA